MLGQTKIILAGGLLAGLVAAPAHAGIAVIIEFDDNSGLSAEAEFELINNLTLQVRLKNTSTMAPDGFSNSDQILTGLSWDFGDMGAGMGDTAIAGGSVIIGPNGQTLNFDTGDYGPGTDVSGEWGYGNNNGTGAMQNFFSATTSQAMPFGGANLDGPVNIDGPSGGIVADPLLIPLGGMGAIQDEVIATLNLTKPINDLSFLQNGLRVEFGSDAYFINGALPVPGALAVLAMAGLVGSRRRR